MTVYFFPNGNTAVFKDEEQQPALQHSWLIKFAEFLESQGEDPTKMEYHMPGNGWRAEIYRMESGGFNWHVKK